MADADFEVTLGEGLIDGKTHFELVGLELDPSDPDRMQALTKRLSMPLPSALDLLRNKNGQIELDVPIKGRLEDPDFDVSDAINQALGSAMKTGVFAYLKYALQPYGTLISLASMAGEAATRVRLDPVTYDPGSTEPRADLPAYLGKVAALLGDKPAAAAPSTAAFAAGRVRRDCLERRDRVTGTAGRGRPARRGTGAAGRSRATGAGPGPPARRNDQVGTGGDARYRGAAPAGMPAAVRSGGRGGGPRRVADITYRPSRS